MIVNPVNTDWATLALGQQIEHLEVEGYVVIPDLLNPDHMARLRIELTKIETRGTDYTDKKQCFNDIQWAGGAITELIAHAPMVTFLHRIFGCDPILMTYDYACSEPGCPAINLHCDGQPWGSKIFGPEQSCPRLVRVLYYLQDLTADTAPFRVIPRSHLSFHNDANPYLRYREHPEQVMVTCKAGSAVLINQNVFHGNYPNQGNRNREMLGLAYRPTWSGPCDKVEPWDPDKLAKVSDAVRKVMQDRNQRVELYNGGNTPADMRSDPEGISPSRWQWK